VPIRDESGAVIKWYGLNTDVEDLKEAQREIARTAAALAEGQKMSRTGSWSWRPATDTFELSEECARIFGFSQEDTPPTFVAMVERVHPEDRASLRPLDAAEASAARDAYSERRVIRPDGTIVFVESRTRAVRDARGQTVEYVGTVRDLTEAKAAQHRIQESERRYAATLSSIGDAVISTDDRGRLTFINPVAEKLTGWTMPEAAEQRVSEVFRLIDEARNVVHDPVSEILGKELDPATGLQYVLRSRAGMELTIDVSGAPIIDARGEMEGAVLVFRDMTQRNETAEALRRSKEDLARMSRLTAIGELAVSVAHEMNQPLMAIVTNAAASMSWLQGSAPNICEAVQAIEWVLRDGHRAGEVLSSILALARNSGPKVEPLSIHTVIDEVLLLTKSDLRQKGVVVETDYKSEVDLVNGDRIQLQQVLINLVMNGAEAMAGLEDERRTLRVATTRQDDNLIRVSVTDSGIGLDPDTADHAFEAFFTTKATGIGMGLSICRSIIEAHGGQIWVTTENTKGSTFSFTLQPPPSSIEQSEALAG
jgi:PAS domain S-box-containing protein